MAPIHDFFVERVRGTAADLHGLQMPSDGRRRLWVLEVTRPALVLGSTQAADVVVEDPGVDVVRRRSGGGAVWVEPDDPIWVDVLIPRGDRSWDDDVGRSFLPIGRAWSAALADQGFGATSVHTGPMVRTEWSGLVCFAGTGPGEVLADGRKVVGIAQRRTRAGARFQCAVPRRWDPGPLRRRLLAPPPAEIAEAWGTGVGTLDADGLVEAFARALR